MTETNALARDVLKEIQRYRDQCPEYVAFPAITADHELAVAVTKLISYYSPSYLLPGEGNNLWRKLVQSSVTPDPEDNYQVFDNLDAFTTWIMTGYQIPFDITPDGKVEKLRKRWLQANGKLKPTAQKVYDQVTTSPRKGPAIIKSSGWTPSHGREILAALTRLGFIKHIKNSGYVRA